MISSTTINLSELVVGSGHRPPHHRGRQAAMQAFTLPSTARSILATAYPNDVDRIRALNDGVVCYLRKPVNEQHLKRCLHAALTSDELTPEENSWSHLLVGQGELKYGAARFIRIRPQPAPMGIDDRPADRQPHPYAARISWCRKPRKRARDVPDQCPAQYRALPRGRHLSGFARC